MGLVLQGALAHVLDGHAGHDHGDVVEHAEPVGLHQHARHLWIHRDASDVASNRGEHGCTVALLVRDCAEFVQEQQPVAHGLSIRRLNEGEVVDVAQAQGDHLQHNGGQVGAQDFRVGELGARLEVVLGVQTDGHAVCDAAGAAGALVGGGL